MAVSTIPKVIGRPPQIGTLSERGRDPVLLRQLMDFLMLLDRNVRVVIEVDGSQHYSEGDRPAPSDRNPERARTRSGAVAPAHGFPDAVGPQCSRGDRGGWQSALFRR